MANVSGQHEPLTADDGHGVKRRRLLRFGTLVTAFTGYSAISALGASGANAAPGDKNPTTYVPTAEKGAASGVATLGTDSKIPSAQVPDLSATYANRPNRAKNAITGWYHVDGFGAKGDNVTDDLPAIQAAYGACAKGDTLFFPPGTYKLSGQWVVDRSVNVVFAGWGQELTDNSSSGARLVPLSATAQAGMESLIKVTTSNTTWKNLAVQGIQYIHGSIGVLVEGTPTKHAHGNDFSGGAVYGFGHGFMHGSWSDHTTIDHTKISGNTHGVGIAKDNHYDFSHADCRFDGNVQSSVHLLSDASAVNTTFLRTHLGFSQYGLYQDDTDSGNGFAGLTLIDSPIEYVSVQHMRMVNGGNINISGGYFTWNGAPANPAVAIGQINQGPVWFNTRLDAGFPNPNSPSVIHVRNYTNFPIYADSSLNGFAQQMFSGYFRSPRVKKLLVNGAYTVPPGVTAIRVDLCAPGGGGGGGGGNGGMPGAGGAAGQSVTQFLDVLPGQSYTLVLQSPGAGGAGGSAGGGDGTAGTNGGTSTFSGPGGTVFCRGGIGGAGGSGASSASTMSSAFGALRRIPASQEQAGCGGGSTTTTAYSGGDNPSGIAGAGGGSGGLASGARGGGAGDAGNTFGGAAGGTGASATANGVSGVSAFNVKGSGGGGGGAGGTGGTGGSGGAGTLGYCIVTAIA